LRRLGFLTNGLFDEDDPRRGHERKTPRTTTPQGPARLMFAPDLVGTSAEIAEQLHAHAAFREIDEVVFALPFTFDHDDYVQILSDMVARLGPALGWQPTTGGPQGEH
jgi:alkanesulfonate monooxygenase SsuD/methylene tetrahydromethanopterin reductase-like flavin-dependent oxidoreductase (luciferase family)